MIQYIYERYGRERAAICATVIHYRPRMAIREVGKALGLTEDITAALAEHGLGQLGRRACPTSTSGRPGSIPTNPAIRQAIDARAASCIGFPRHLSQHVGGFVLTRARLDETVPIGNAAMEDRTFIEWDKDDIDALGMMKVDVLALGMLTCIRKRPRLPAQPLPAPTSPTSPTSRRTTRRSTRCSRAPIPSACSRSRAGRRCRCCRG